jgi:hypothetical protein
MPSFNHACCMFVQSGRAICRPAAPAAPAVHQLMSSCVERHLRCLAAAVLGKSHYKLNIILAEAIYCTYRTFLLVPAAALHRRLPAACKRPRQPHYMPQHPSSLSASMYCYFANMTAHAVAKRVRCIQVQEVEPRLPCQAGRRSAAVQQTDNF